MKNQEKIDYLSEVIRDCVNTLAKYDYWEDGQDDADWFYSEVMNKINE